MKIAMASDHGGYEYKEAIKEMLIDQGHEVKDFGCYSSESVDYVDMIAPACESVSRKEYDRGIVLCGTGIGASITANKVKGIRCALVSDIFTARVTREHNDSNVLALGERVLGIEVCLEIVNTWLNTEFSGDERHERRIKKLMELENE